MTIDWKNIGAASALALSFLATPLLAQDMGEWDANADGVIDQDEFNTGFGDTGTFGGWDGDGDGSLTEEEFNAGLYDGYDADDSGGVEEPEFGDIGDDIGDGGLFDI